MARDQLLEDLLALGWSQRNRKLCRTGLLGDGDDLLSWLMMMLRIGDVALAKGAECDDMG